MSDIIKEVVEEYFDISEGTLGEGIIKELKQAIAKKIRTLYKFKGRYYDCDELMVELGLSEDKNG